MTVTPTRQLAVAAATIPGANEDAARARRLETVPDLLPAQDPRPGAGRPRVDGRFLAAGGERLVVRGVTYGTFAPDPDRPDERLPDPQRVHRDFGAMAASGVNAVRIYTTPPRWLLDTAFNHGLWVMAGLPWEQHVAFLQGRRRARDVVGRTGAAALQVAGHPALLCFAVGNEIPAPIVRWHGRARVERFIGRLAGAVREADDQALVTYANYPSTEYLRPPGLDVVTFNVYLEQPDRLGRYLPRLHNLADERPLMLGEVGLDSRSHGRVRQASGLGDQLALTYASGCAGAFVFAWTDDWHRAEPVEDWDFGLTDRDRRPKPALGAVRRAFADVPVAPPADAPRISVLVCTHNGGATLRECLEGCGRLRYPNCQVVVVDDGSTDDTAQIAAEFPVTLIRTENRGLSAARNTALAAADGSLVAYIDDDARPDPDWLTYLSAAFARDDHAGIGGPNLPPDDDGWWATCVANAPGGPVHVLLSDTTAEHIPGCNMAFRREALEAIGGFDPRFRVAGDDVDVCWRLQDAGYSLGFHAAAVVWHRRRASLRAFWRQQRGYGRAEALLERKWPEKYNVPGNLAWAGRLYGSGTGGGLRGQRIYHGPWGTGAFQSAHDREPGSLRALADLARAPEWYLVLAVLAAGSLLGLLWHPLLAVAPVLALATCALIVYAATGAARARSGTHGRTRRARVRLQAAVGLLHLLQPAARLRGRLGDGLAPWRRPDQAGATVPLPRRRSLWFSSWRPVEVRLGELEQTLRSAGTRVRRSGPYDRWDLHAAGGGAGSARLRTTVENHADGQLWRCHVRPRISAASTGATVLLAAVAIAAAAANAWAASTILATAAVILATAAGFEAGIATASLLRALGGAGEAAEEER